MAMSRQQEYKRTILQNRHISVEATACHIMAPHDFSRRQTPDEDRRYRIENSAAVVPGVKIMVCDAFPAEIVVGTFHPARNLLCAALIANVLIGFPFVMF